MGFETLAIHAGQEADPRTGAVVTPISLATTFAQDGVGSLRGGYEYARSANPTRDALERCLAALEGAEVGLAFASGLAAEDALLRTLPDGSHVAMLPDAYGGTWRLMSRVHGSRLHVDTADLSDLDALARAWTDETRMVWLETPSNPLLTVTDIAAVAAFARGRGAATVVDNTFATPWLQRPLALGADVVVHSTTKYLGGHSDVTGGFLALAAGERADRLRFLQNAAGAVPGPFDCYLVLRGIKTLALRMERHCANAAAVAGLLAEHPAVSRVLWPGRPDHPGHEVAARQMRSFGGMVSFLCAGGEDAALEVVRGTRLFTLAESLGAVESLVEHPARMTHASAAGSPLAVDPALVRLSVGIETTADLLDDLRAALDSV
ncbi:MAG TPA: cystathionine gamma-synthase [Acidimicrobiales bacterium]|nr:cystathionine gamma-synthase [Acidimicrobiales bacterium]